MLPHLLPQPAKKLTLLEVAKDVLMIFKEDVSLSPEEFEFYIDAEDELWAFKGHEAYFWRFDEWLSDADNDDN